MVRNLLRSAALVFALAVTLSVALPKKAQARVFQFTQCVNHQEQICVESCESRGGCVETCRPDGNSC
ncbi:MAG TPA: hypothetical protein VGE98_09630 [Thermoanaerobaculia bacterium]